MDQKIVQKHWRNFNLWFFSATILPLFVLFFFPFYILNLSEVFYIFFFAFIKLFVIFVVLFMFGKYGKIFGGSRFIGLWCIIPLLGFIIVWFSMRSLKNKISMSIK